MYLQQIQLYTPALDVIRPFYRWLPGLDVQEESNDAMRLWCPSRAGRLAFLAGGASTEHHLLLQLEARSVEQVHDALAKALQRAPVLLDPHTLQARDPGGHLLTLQIEAGKQAKGWFVSGVHGLGVSVQDPDALREALHQRFGEQATGSLQIGSIQGDPGGAPQSELTLADGEGAALLRIEGGVARLGGTGEGHRERIEIAGVPLIRVQRQHGFTLWADGERPFAWGHTHPWVGTAISMVITNGRRVNQARLDALLAGDGFGDQGFGIWPLRDASGDSRYAEAAQVVRRAYEAWRGEPFEGSMLVLEPAWRDERGPGYMPQPVLAQIVSEAVWLHRNGARAPWLFRDPPLQPFASIEPDNPEWAALEPLEALLHSGELVDRFVPPEPGAEALCRRLGLRSTAAFRMKLRFLEEAELPACLDHYWYWLRDVHGMLEAYLPIFTHHPGVLRDRDREALSRQEEHLEQGGAGNTWWPRGVHLHAERRRLLRDWSLPLLAAQHEAAILLWRYLHSDTRRARLGEVWKGVLAESCLSADWFAALQLPDGAEPFAFTAACEASLGGREPDPQEVLSIEGVRYHPEVSRDRISSCRLGEGWRIRLAGLRRA